MLLRSGAQNTQACTHTHTQAQQHADGDKARTPVSHGAHTTGEHKVSGSQEGIRCAHSVMAAHADT